MTNNPPPNDLPPTSVSLLDGVRQNVTGSWGRFTDFYGPLVYGKCRRAGLTEHDAQDVVQNVFVKVFKSIHTFRRSPPEMLFRKWFKVVTRSVLTDFMRRQQKTPDQAIGESSQMSWSNLVAVVDDEATFTAQDSDMTLAVRRLMESLKPEYEERNWQAFWLTAVEDISPQEVAERLGMTSGNVRQVKLRISRRLATELAELLE